jgi:polysaccharide export outer membrane protein
MKVNFKYLILSILLVFIIGLNSCVSKKEIVYFQDLERDTVLVTNQKYNIVFHPGDIITITVSAADLESVKPFNMPVVSFSASDGRISGAQRLQDYLVDIYGDIDFPVLGKIHIANLTRKEATDLLVEKLKEYINNPIVNIRLTNFKITVLGEVRSPGTYVVQNERITLPEALGLAGDMTISGKRDNVLVVRDIGGEQYKFRVNLTTDDVFKSPVYFLAQNDVIYVEPKKALIRDSSFGKSTSIAFSVISSLVSLGVLVISIISLSK